LLGTVFRFSGGALTVVGRWDLTHNEWESLVRLYEGEDANLSNETVARLTELGFIESGGGDTLSTAGRMLVEHELLAERRNRLQR
jgi:hypothetical protein